MCGDTCGNSAMQNVLRRVFGMRNLCFPEQLQRTLGSPLALTLATEDSFLLGGMRTMRTRARSADTSPSSCRDGGIGAECIGYWEQCQYGLKGDR